MNGKILLFQVEDVQIVEKIRRAVLPQQVMVQTVEVQEYDQTIGKIAMLPTGGDYHGLPLSEAMMVLCVAQEKLDSILLALRNAGLPPFCKAVLTPTNAGWTPVQLLTELQRERAEFGKMKT